MHLAKKVLFAIVAMGVAMAVLAPAASAATVRSPAPYSLTGALEGLPAVPELKQTLDNLLGGDTEGGVVKRF